MTRFYRVPARTRIATEELDDAPEVKNDPAPESIPETQDVTSNPDEDKKEDRVSTIEEVVELEAEVQEEIEEIQADVEEAQEAKESLEKIETVAQEALEDDVVTPQLGEATHILLSDLFGKAGITETSMLPSVEMFKNPKTAKAAMSIAVESIGVAKTRIDTSSALAQRVMYAKQKELDASVEAFSDSVKDFFSASVSTKDVGKISEVANIALAASNGKIDPYMKEETGLSYYFNTPKALQYMAKDLGVVANIAQGISEDADNLNVLTTFLKVVTGEVRKGNNADMGVVQKAVQNIGELSFQGGAWVYAGKNKPKMDRFSSLSTEESSVEGLFFASVIPIVATGAILGVLFGLPVAAAATLYAPTASVGGVASLVGNIINNKLFKQDSVKIQDSLFKSKDQFSASAKKYSVALKTFSDAARDFLSVRESDKKSDNSELRDIIRIGNGMVNKVYSIARIAEPFYKKIA